MKKLRPDRAVARWLGLGCWCCGDWRPKRILVYRREKRRIFPVTWCRPCKFCACQRCGDDYEQNKEQLHKMFKKYRRKID